MCSVLNHLCGHACSALNCRGKCQVAHGTDHTVHKCMDGICTHICSVPGCLQVSASPTPSYHLQSACLHTNTCIEITTNLHQLE